MKAFRQLHRLRLWGRRRLRAPGLHRAAPAMAEWFATPAGRAMLAREEAFLERVLPDLFGYHLMQLGIDPARDLSRASRISHRFTLSVRPLQSSALSQLVATEDQLPLPSESVDLVILHHSLEFSRAPHQLLREAQRVLIPRGHLVVLGFNPGSSFGLIGAVARWFSPHPLWRKRTLRLGRLLDWLQLLDLAPGQVERDFFRPPLRSGGALARLAWLDRWGRLLRLPGGAFYAVLACKEVGAAVAVKPQWRRDRSPLSGLMAPERQRHKSDESSVKSKRYRGYLEKS